MRRLLPVALVLASCAFATAQNARASWVRYAPESGNFSIMFPAAPEERTDTKTFSSGTVITHLAMAKVTDLLCLTGVTDYPVDVEVENELTLDRDNFVKEVKATVSSSRRTTFARGPGDEHPALEFVATSEQYTFKVLVVLIDKRHTYLVVTGNRNGSDHTADIEYFFNSFKLTSKKS